MNQIQHQSEARLLTDRLRNSVAQGERHRKQEMISERDGNLQMVVEGTVVRQRIMADGRCQTIAVYQRDDVINLSRFVRKQANTDNLVALSGSVLASVEPAVVEELRQMSTSGVDGMAALVLRELSISQERLMCLGQRSAVQAMAHFFCETLVRSRDPLINWTSESCTLAMTQEMLAETLGMSSVHVNRTVQQLRAKKLIEFMHFELKIRNWDELADLGEFDGGYLAPV
jgi:CRP-like cAMP-binding protein